MQTRLPCTAPEYCNRKHDGTWAAALNHNSSSGTQTFAQQHITSFNHFNQTLSFPPLSLLLYSSIAILCSVKKLRPRPFLLPQHSSPTHMARKLHLVTWATNSQETDVCVSHNQTGTRPRVCKAMEAHS